MTGPDPRRKRRKRTSTVAVPGRGTGHCLTPGRRRRRSSATGHIRRTGLQRRNVIGHTRRRGQPRREKRKIVPDPGTKIGPDLEARIGRDHVTMIGQGPGRRRRRSGAMTGTDPGAGTDTEKNGIETLKRKNGTGLIVTDEKMMRDEEKKIANKDGKKIGEGTKIESGTSAGTRSENARDEGTRREIGRDEEKRTENGTDGRTRTGKDGEKKKE